MTDIAPCPLVLERMAVLARAVFPKLGKRNMLDFDGCWTYRVDDRWWFAMNGRRTPQRVDVSAAPGHGEGPSIETVPAFAALVMCNGWPAGIVNPNGGVIAAGDLGNEELLLDALNAAIERETST